MADDGGALQPLYKQGAEAVSVLTIVTNELVVLWAYHQGQDE